MLSISGGGPFIVTADALYQWWWPLYSDCCALYRWSFISVFIVWTAVSCLFVVGKLRLTLHSSVVGALLLLGYEV